MPSCSININGSPYHWRKVAGRERMIATAAADASRAIVYVNQVGGQDELVFDGGSIVFDAEGNLLARAPQFVEQLMIVDVPIPPVYRKRLLDPRGRGPRSSCRWCTSVTHRGHAEFRTSMPTTRSNPMARRSIRRASCTTRSCSARVTTAARTASPTS